MAGKLIRDVKSRCYPAIGVTLAALLCLISAWVVSRRFTTSAIVPSAIDTFPLASSELPKAAAQPTTAPSVKRLLPRAASQPADVLPGKRTGTAGIRYGVLRIGNPTGYPVRVALLSRKGSDEAESAIAKVSEPLGYEVPAHWDFAPEEGGANGLLVSLPDRALKLKKGDVLVAFAQDGSGRYWGPYVVDETAVPVWKTKAVEWQLILQP